MQISTRKIGVVQLCPLEAGVAEICIPQISPPQRGTFHLCMPQIGAAQARVIQIRALQICVAEIRLAKIGAPQGETLQLRMLKIGFLATRRFRSVPGAVIDQDLFRAIDWQLSHSGGCHRAISSPSPSHL